MKKTIVFLAMSSCLILGSSLARANSDSSQGKNDDKIFTIDQTMFKAMDKNSDAKVTKEEFKNYTKMKNVSDFDVWDVDGNGDIDSWEMKIMAQRNESQPNTGSSSGQAKNMNDSGGQKQDNSSPNKNNSNHGGDTSQSPEH